MIKYIGFELAEPSATRPHIAFCASDITFDGEFLTLTSNGIKANISETFRRDAYTLTFFVDGEVADCYTVPTLGQAFDLFAAKISGRI